MLLDRSVQMIPQLKFTLTFDNGVSKSITVKQHDIVECTYYDMGKTATITGEVTKILASTNSSLGECCCDAKMIIDGSSNYSGQVVQVRPNQVLNLYVKETSNTNTNVVCSVDNVDQRITLIRENEIGQFQYSLDGITWVTISGIEGQRGPVGPAGKNGVDGKNGADGKDGVDGKDGIDGVSAYQYAVDAGYPGTEEEFAEALASIGVKVTYDSELSEDSENAVQNKVLTAKFKEMEKRVSDVEEQSSSAPTSQEISQIAPIIIEDTVDDKIGNFAVYGDTNPDTFESTKVSSIKIANQNNPSEYQEIVFDAPIILRSVPTDNPSCGTIIIDDLRYACDFIGKFNDQFGIIRKVAYIESYTNECIISDFITSTGSLEPGAQVQYVIHEEFEPFSDEIQEIFKSLHTYDGITSIVVNDPAYTVLKYSVSLDKYVENKVEELINEIGVDNFKDYVEQRLGIPTDMTVKEYVDRAAISGSIDMNVLNQVVLEAVDKRIGDIPEDQTVKSYIDNSDNDAVSF